MSKWAAMFVAQITTPRGNKQMVLNLETKRKMREMGYSGLVDMLDEQNNNEDYMAMPMEQRLSIAVDAAYSGFIDEKVKGLVSRTHLRYPDADVRQVAHIEERKLNHDLLLELSTCNFVQTRTNIVFHGPTGSGKSFLGNALLKEACRHLRRCFYVRVPDLEDQWDVAQNKEKGVTKLLTKLANYDCLCLDEWLLDSPEHEFRSFLFELVERRYDVAPTILCTQYPKKDWHQRLGGGVHADAILDRLVHNAVWFYSGDVNMRERLSKEQNLPH